MGKRTPAVINQAEERQRLLESVKRSVAKNPFLSIAFGLYWMQTTLLFQSPYLFLEPSPLSGFPLPKGTVLLVASVATYLIWSILYKRINAVSMRRWFPFTLGAVLSFGALLFTCYPEFAYTHHDIAVILYLLGSILIGCGTANVNLEASRILGHIGPKQALFHLVFALLIGTAGAYFFSLLPLAAGKIAIVAVPIPMVYCLMKSFDAVPRKAVYSHGMKTEVKLPTKFLVTSAFQGLALGVMHSLLVNSFENSALLVSLGFFAAIGLVFFCSIMLKSDFNLLFYRIGFPLMATGFFLLGIAPSMVEMGAAVLDVGYCFQYLISCSLCAYLAKGLNQPPVWIVGTSTACLLAGQLVGTVFEAVAPDQTALAVTVAFVLVLAALYMTSNQNLRRGWGAVSPGSDHKADSGANEALAVQVLASEHGLSARETEVYALLVKGYSRKAIGEELCLAEETIKTHAGRIYQKFLVHSKQELIAMTHERAATLGE